MMSPRRLAVELTGRLDGPHAGEHTVGAADLAAEAVRFLNYATGHHADEGGLTWPSTVYEVTAALSSMASRMPQLTGQMSRWLAGELEAGRLAMDDRTDPALAVARARARLEAAGVAAARLAGELSAVQEALGRVNGNGPGREGGAR